MLRSYDPVKRAAVHRALIAQMEDAAGGPGPRYDIRHLPAALVLGEAVRFPYRGVTYEVRGLPYAAGLRLAAVSATLNRLAGAPMELGALREFEQALTEAAGIFRRYARPAWPQGVRHWLTGAVVRLAYALVRNPFERATEAEMGELLGFFLSCRAWRTTRPAATASAPGSRASLSTARTT